MNRRRAPTFNGSTFQRGMATLLTVLLGAIALTVTALGVLYLVGSSGQKQFAVHASTNAKAGAWAGVELIRKYLIERANVSTTLTDLPSGISVGLGSNTVSVSWQSVVATSATQYRITANVRSQNGPARSSAVVQAVYDVSLGGSSPADVSLSSTLYIGHNLNMSGGIVFKGDNARFVVNGSSTLSSASITGLKSLKATGNIVLGSAISVPEVFSNGTLTLNGGASTLNGSALGDITVSSGGSQGVLSTNANLTISNGSVAAGNALGFIAVSSGGSQGTLTAGKTISISNGTTTESDAVGNITISSWPTTTRVNSQATVTCPSQWWTQFSSIRAKATSGCPAANVVAPAAVSVNLMAPLTALGVTQPKIDAYLLQNSANYVFQYSNGREMVTVNNVQGIANGTYYLGAYGWQSGRGWHDFLCAQVDTNGNCTSPSVPNASLRTICQGFSTSNGCFSYNASTSTWTISGKNLAPGVMWFSGHLNLSDGTYYNTFIATGNIATSGSHVTYAENYTGYATICQNQYPLNATNDFLGLYPTQLCNASAGTLKTNAIGNIAYLAGGYVGTVFSGGQITLGASTLVYGSVLAGDVLVTGGSSTVYGYVVAAGEGASTANTWGGSTTIDVTNLPSTYAPDKVPDMTAAGSTSTPTPATATLVWSRYL